MVSTKPTHGIVVAKDEQSYFSDYGTSYNFSVEEKDLSDGDSVYFIIDVGELPVRVFNSKIKADGGPIHIDLLENVELDGSETSETATNFDRISAKSSLTNVYTATDVTSDGTTLSKEKIYTGDGAVKAGDSIDAGRWRFKPDTTYAIKVTNENGEANDICLNFTWSEETR